MTQETYRYCLSKNDLDIISYHNKDKPLSENARKTLTILSEVFGGLHHLEDSQLKHFDYQSDFYNSYLLKRNLATWDSQELTLLVIIAHDMAVRLEIQPRLLDKTDPDDLVYIKELLRECDSDYKISVDDIEPSAYLRLIFHQRSREGCFSSRHPTLEDTIEGFRKGNRRYA